jgi:hypothetical protein
MTNDAETTMEERRCSECYSTVEEIQSMFCNECHDKRSWWYTTTLLQPDQIGMEIMVDSDSDSCCSIDLSSEDKFIDMFPQYTAFGETTYSTSEHLFQKNQVDMEIVVEDVGSDSCSDNDSYCNNEISSDNEVIEMFSNYATDKRKDYTTVRPSSTPVLNAAEHTEYVPLHNAAHSDTQTPIDMSQQRTNPLDNEDTSDRRVRQRLTVPVSGLLPNSAVHACENCQRTTTSINFFAKVNANSTFSRRVLVRVNPPDRVATTETRRVLLDRLVQVRKH